MSTFSRGSTCLTHLRIHSLPIPRCRSPIFQLPQTKRLFSVRTPLYKSPKRAPPKKATTKPHAFKAPVSLPVTPPPKTYQSFTSTLALRSSPTLLYQAPSHTIYIFGSYAFGLFCFAYAGFNFHANYINAPPDISAWVPITFGGVCFAMACFGTWLVLGPSRYVTVAGAVSLVLERAKTANRLIKAIYAIPSTLTKTPSSSPLLIRLDLRRTIPLPFLPPRNILVPSTSISLSTPLFHPSPGPPTPAQRREVAAQEARQREIERTRILTAPFRHFWYFSKRVMRALVRVWSREGFVKVKVEGKAGVWRLDREGGWMLDEGRGIDRIAKGRPLSGGLISAA